MKFTLRSVAPQTPSIDTYRYVVVRDRPTHDADHVDANGVPHVLDGDHDVRMAFTSGGKRRLVTT
jgi:hypothetical protein